MFLLSDFGFDPLGLGEVPENLERFKESEVYHCRWAMLAVVSYYFPLPSLVLVISIYSLVWSGLLLT